MDKKISVIIPSYNEEKNIKKTIDRVRKIGPDYEIIVVDDGSIDNTFKVANDAGAIAFRLKKNTGKGAAFRKGIEEATGDVIVQVDADSQFMPEEIPKLIQPILDDKADATLGSRFTKGSVIEEGALSARNKIGNYGDSLLTSIACRHRVTDVQAGFKAFKGKELKEIKFREDHFGYEPELVILAKKKGLRIVDVPIFYKKRRGGQSNINFLKDVYIISKAIIRTTLFG